jgi:hypothetical protein
MFTPGGIETSPGAAKTRLRRAYRSLDERQLNTQACATKKTPPRAGLSGKRPGDEKLPGSM